MRPCGPAPCLRFETSCAREAGQHWVFPLLDQSGEATLFIGVHLFGTSSTAELPEPILKRLLCHALLQRLPNDGLDEALQSLYDMNEFYRIPRYVPPPPLPRKSMPVRMGPGYVRPVFPVTEEE